MRNNKVIINFTPTGMIPTKEMTPYVPISPKEIADEVIVALNYGVSMVHLHARDEKGFPTYKKSIYEKIIKLIREKSKDVVICVSTSGRNWHEFEKRSECLEIKNELKPDMGSLTLSSLNFNKIASVNTPDMIQALAKKMLDLDIKPELEVFDVGMVNYAKYLFSKGLIKPPFYFNLILGNIACAQANIDDLAHILNKLPDNSYWSIGGIGSNQLKMNMNGIINGGGIRIGLEDNIWFDKDRVELATNMNLLKRVNLIIKTLGIEIASPKEVREMLNLRRVDE